MTGGAVYLLLGLSLLLAIVLPQVTHRFPVSPTMVLVGVGMAIGLLPVEDAVSLDPQDHRTLVTHLTELTVIVSLMGVGLAIDRGLAPRSWRSWRTWSPVWRLLLVTMPLTILGVAVLGWWVAGLAPAVALLLGAVLAPTDPVLASDVQLERPGDRNRLRFSLTGEAGLNDGTAFPFVMLGLGLLGAHEIGAWGWRWLAVDVVWAIVAGLAVGFVLGTLVGRIVLFRSRRVEKSHLSSHAMDPAAIDQRLRRGLEQSQHAAAQVAAVGGERRQQDSVAVVRGPGSDPCQATRERGGTSGQRGGAIVAAQLGFVLERAAGETVERLERQRARDQTGDGAPQWIAPFEMRELLSTVDGLLKA